MNLIKFDENNSDHMDAFNYFAYDSGHPEYLVNNIISDFDFDFREFISNKFDLPPEFVDNQNGACHEISNRNNDKVECRIFYSYDDENEEDQEILFEFTGQLFFNTETKKVVLKPEENTISMV